MEQIRVIVIGAGIGGLSAAAALSRQGLSVTVLERAGYVGGKIASERIGGQDIDVGPTVVTMRWALDEVFAAAGARLDNLVQLEPLAVIGRHFWPDGSQLDLFPDIEQTCDAIARFAGAKEAQAYVRFARHAADIHAFVDKTFIRAERPTLASTLRDAIKHGPRAMLGIDSHRTMDEALRSFFRDPRLIQLFGRYATYCGSSPFSAPATLNVISHVERVGVHRVVGGLGQIAQAMARVARRNGSEIRLGAHVQAIRTRSNRVVGVQLADGEFIAAEVVVFNGDVNAIASGLLGPRLRESVPATRQHSLSAFTMAMLGHFSGPELEHHNVFFSSDGAREFAELRAGKQPTEPTIYLCAEDRRGAGDTLGDAAERAFMIVNAPASAAPQPTAAEANRCETQIWNQLSKFGMSFKTEHPIVMATPSSYASRFPGTDGAIYGPETTGMWSSFARAGSRTKTRGLYLTGGSVHPGAGVPMAALSGKLAAQTVLEDQASTVASPIMVMAGGTPTS